MRSQDSSASSREPRTWTSSAPDCTSAIKSVELFHRDDVVLLGVDLVA